MENTKNIGAVIKTDPFTVCNLVCLYGHWFNMYKKMPLQAIMGMTDLRNLFCTTTKNWGKSNNEFNG